MRVQCVKADNGVGVSDILWAGSVLRRLDKEGATSRDDESADETLHIQDRLLSMVDDGGG